MQKMADCWGLILCSFTPLVWELSCLVNHCITTTYNDGKCCMIVLDSYSQKRNLKFPCSFQTVSYYALKQSFWGWWPVKYLGLSHYQIVINQDNNTGNSDIRSMVDFDSEIKQLYTNFTWCKAGSSKVWILKSMWNRWHLGIQLFTRYRQNSAIQSLQK